jgi:predicted negative regulator of RcsB-dependent stress response
MNILLALITSGSIRYILFAAVLLFGGIFGFYKYNMAIHDARTQAQLEYNIKQLEQVVKDKDTYIKQMEDINKSKSAIIADLYKHTDELNEKIKDIEVAIANDPDRESSVVLKDAFRKLGEMQ